MTYNRVMPRDLFNEAKLLKCMGRIELFILDDKIKGLNSLHNTDTNAGFTIEQDSSDGSIYIANLHYMDNEANAIHFYTSLNSKYNYPLTMVYKDEEYYPFNEKGQYQLDATLFIKKAA